MLGSVTSIGRHPATDEQTREMVSIGEHTCPLCNESHPAGTTGIPRSLLERGAVTVLRTCPRNGRRYQLEVSTPT